jgi:hypothetical protein
MAKKSKTESLSVKRLRNRLKKHIAQQDKAISPEALAARAELIRAILAQNSQSRVILKEKSIRVFDQETPAKETKATERIRKMIKKDYFR